MSRVRWGWYLTLVKTTSRWGAGEPIRWVEELLRPRSLELVFRLARVRVCVQCCFCAWPFVHCFCVLLLLPLLPLPPAACPRLSDGAIDRLATPHSAPRLHLSPRSVGFLAPRSGRSGLVPRDSLSLSLSLPAFSHAALEWVSQAVRAVSACLCVEDGVQRSSVLPPPSSLPSRSSLLEFLGASGDLVSKPPFNPHFPAKGQPPTTTLFKPQFYLTCAIWENLIKQMRSEHLAFSKITHLKMNHINIVRIYRTDNVSVQISEGRIWHGLWQSREVDLCVVAAPGRPPQMDTLG